MKQIDINIVNKSNNKIPKYETAGSAGMDVKAYITQENSNSMEMDTNGEIEYIYTINPGERAMIHTGLYMSVAVGYEMQVRPRSGLAIKKGIIVINSPGTIDSDYRGECNVLLYNASNTPFIIKNGDRIAQWILNEVPRVNFNIVDSLDDTDRGVGGFGSTGK